jgi:hypothetical protein
MKQSKLRLVVITATPENPLDNIQTLKQVSLVMKNGRAMRQTG